MSGHEISEFLTNLANEWNVSAAVCRYTGYANKI